MIDRRQIRAQMLENEAQLQDLLTTLDLVVVYVRDLDGTIRFWSEGCVQLFGWPATEAVGRKLHELLGTITPETGDEIRARLLVIGEWSGEVRQFKRDGTEVIVATRKIARRDENGQLVAIMASLVDVTALRRTRTELERLNARLEDLVREEVAKREAALRRAAHAERIQALGQLAGGLAHDLANVLQAIISAASLTAQDAGNPDRVRRLSRMMTEAAQRGAAVTRRLLSFSRRADLRAEPIAPGALLDDLGEVLAHTLGGRVQCEIRVPADLPRLIADRSQLETALVNLATNARDAMPDGGIIVFAASAEILLEPLMHLPALAPGRYIRITVTDTGIGMDATTLARVIEPFYTTKPDGSGTGLGLAVVSGFAQQSNGALAIESTPGVGTTVSLWLREAADESRPIIVRARAPYQDPTRAARVLLVDDDTLVRTALAEQLEQAGYHVTAAASGKDALALLEAGAAPDVLLCDLSMPDMSGLAVIRSAQARNPKLPAVLLTGYLGDPSALPREGARFALLRKPTAMDELADVIAILLASE